MSRLERSFLNERLLNTPSIEKKSDRSIYYSITASSNIISLLFNTSNRILYLYSQLC